MEFVKHSGRLLQLADESLKENYGSVDIGKNSKMRISRFFARNFVSPDRAKNLHRSKLGSYKCVCKRILRLGEWNFFTIFFQLANILWYDK